MLCTSFMQACYAIWSTYLCCAVWSSCKYAVQFGHVKYQKELNTFLLFNSLQYSQTDFLSQTDQYALLLSHNFAHLSLCLPYNDYSITHLFETSIYWNCQAAGCVPAQPQSDLLSIPVAFLILKICGTWENAHPP